MSNFQEFLKISDFSKLSLKYIHKLTGILLEIVKEILFTGAGEKLEKLLSELDEKSLELLDVWDGLKSHVYNATLRSHSSYPAQIDQLSFLMHYIRSGQYFCSCSMCSKSEASKETIYFHDLEGCLQLLKKLVGDLFGSE
jgi:hypothetical protein